MRGRRSRGLELFLVGALLAGGCGDVSPRTSELRAEVEAVIDAGAPGALLWAGGPGAGPFVFAAGAATLRPRTALRVNTPQHVGSLTKTFTAVLVLQLVDEGRLALDETIAGHLPQGLVPDAERITVRQLLQHTSGLHDYFDVGTESGPGTVWEPLRRDPSFAYEPEELVALGVSAGADFAPGSAYSYSNTGYVVLGMILEAVTGESLPRLYEERIFAPLGLDDTVFPVTAADGRSGRAHCYTRFLDPDADELQDVDDLDPSFAWAAGAIISTTRDVARFYQALLLRRELLSPAALHEMTTSLVATAQAGTSYGLGIMRTGEGTSQMWWHNGSWPGCTATAAVLTEQQVTVVQLQNVGLADQSDALTSAIGAELAAALEAAGGSL